MVGNDKVRLIFIDFFCGLENLFISETHSIEHSDGPDADEKVTVFVMFFSER